MAKKNDMTHSKPTKEVGSIGVTMFLGQNGKKNHDMTHSKPTKEVGSKGVTMFFVSHFVTYFMIYKKIALNPPPWGSK